MLTYIAPVFLIMALGAVIRRLPQAPAVTLFPALEWFSFYVAFPALLFLRTASLDLDATVVQSLALLVLTPMAAVLAIVLTGLRLVGSLPGPSRSSVVQGSVRPSTYFGLAVAGLALPDQAATLVMLALALAMPAVNIVAVVALSWWSGRQVTFLGMVRGIVRNPIILATVVGALYNLSDWPLGAIVTKALEILAQVALGLGLVCVGGGLELRLQGAMPRAMVCTNAIKLLLLPGLTWVVCRVLQADHTMTLAACFYASLPTAPNAYIMARQLGGDARLMASLITSQTLIAILSVPLWLAWLGVGS
ncbi:AEC family transporter [Allofranklinella schreckenbergeri]|nr:AEC family transporter [Allofranklinella schreckenbergeri]